MGSIGNLLGRTEHFVVWYEINLSTDDLHHAIHVELTKNPARPVEGDKLLAPLFFKELAKTWKPVRGDPGPAPPTPDGLLLFRERGVSINVARNEPLDFLFTIRKADEVETYEANEGMKFSKLGSLVWDIIEGNGARVSSKDNTAPMEQPREKERTLAPDVEADGLKAYLSPLGAIEALGECSLRASAAPAEPEQPPQDTDPAPSEPLFTPAMVDEALSVLKDAENNARDARVSLAEAEQNARKALELLLAAEKDALEARELLVEAKKTTFARFAMLEAETKARENLALLKKQVNGS